MSNLKRKTEDISNPSSSKKSKPFEISIGFADAFFKHPGNSWENWDSLKNELMTNGDYIDGDLLMQRMIIYKADKLYNELFQAYTKSIELQKQQQLQQQQQQQQQEFQQQQQEFQQQQQQQQQDFQQRLSTILSYFTESHSAEIKKNITIVQLTDREAFQKFFANFPEDSVKRAYSALGFEKAIETEVYVPKIVELFDQISKLDLTSCGLKSGLKDISGHISKDHIFVRECFVEFTSLILTRGKSCTISVTGDPGIGKSLYSLYVFMVLVKMKEKVVRVSQGGSFLIFDGNEIKYSLEASSLWRRSDYWLLLDGRAKEVFWDKPCKGVVFASPNGKNYHEFIKNEGAKFVLPPWSLSEIDDLIDSLDKSTLSSMTENLKRLGELPVANNDDNIHEELKKLAKTRFNFVGGKIRYLFQPNLTTAAIVKELESAVYSFVNLHKASITRLDTQRSTIPSILYCMRPYESLEDKAGDKVAGSSKSNNKSNSKSNNNNHGIKENEYVKLIKKYSNYSISFCSEEARNMVAQHVLLMSKAKRVKFFDIASSNPNSSALASSVKIEGDS